MNDSAPKRKGSLRRLWLRAKIALGVLMLTGAGLPWLAEIGLVRSAVLGWVNQTYKPTAIQIEHVSVSWFGPVRLTGVELRDKNGKAVVSAPSGTLNRSLLQLVFGRPDYGTLTLHGARVQIERDAEGRIDLAEAFGPLLASDPKSPGDSRTDFTLRIEGGSLELRSPELAEPIE